MTDFTLYNHGSICVLTPETAAGKRWVHRNVQTAQIWGNEGYVIEPRYVGPILEGIGAAGLTVSL
jgi:hypothetical protein